MPGKTATGIGQCQQAFGDDVTTRTWATVGKVVAAGRAR